MKSKKLTIKQKFLYGFGDVFGGGGFTIIGLLYTFYLTDVIGLKMIFVAPITFIATAWDAISDPLMGHITDQTKSKMGRRRPYFLFGSMFVLLAFVYLWSPFDFDTQIAKFIYALSAYMLYCTAFTVVMVPYVAYGAELTNDYVERTKLGTVRLILSNASSLVVAILPLTIINLFDDMRMGYLAMSIIFGLMFAAGILSVFFVGKEEKIDEARIKHKLNFFKSFKEALSIKTFRQLIFVYLCGTMGMDIMVAILVYYVKYYVGIEASFVQLFLGTAMITQMVFIPIWTKHIIKTNKSKTYFRGAMIVIVFLSSLLFIPPGYNMYFYLAIIFLVCMGMSAVMFVPHVMFPDCTDVAELAYGKRMEGRLSGVMTFCRKCGRAVGTGSLTLALGLLGYIEGDIGRVSIQSDMVINGIKIILTVFPIIFIAIASLIVRNYVLDGDTHNRLIKHLDFINGKQGGEKMSEAEVEKMKQKLI
jgi:oligogalacturonide transporter